MDELSQISAAGAALEEVALKLSPVTLGTACSAPAAVPMIPTSRSPSSWCRGADAGPVVGAGGGAERSGAEWVQHVITPSCTHNGGGCHRSGTTAGVDHRRCAAPTMVGSRRTSRAALIDATAARTAMQATATWPNRHEAQCPSSLWCGASAPCCADALLAVVSWAPAEVASRPCINRNAPMRRGRATSTQQERRQRGIKRRRYRHFPSAAGRRRVRPAVISGRGAASGVLAAAPRPHRCRHRGPAGGSDSQRSGGP